MGLVISVLLSLWSANKETKGLFEGINIAYREQDERGFFEKDKITFLYTLVATVLGILAIAQVEGFPAVADSLALPQSAATAIGIARWPAATLLVAFLVAYYADQVAADSSREKREPS